MCLRALVFFYFVGVSVTLASVNVLNDLILSGDYEIIDLTHPFNNETVYWPGTQNFVFTKKNEDYRNDGTWYAAKEFAAGEHGGTHLDAPYHFAPHGERVDAIRIEKLILPLIVADISSQVNDDPHYVLYKNRLDYMLNHNKETPCIMLFRFGWSKFFSDRKKYLGIIEGRSILNFPGFSVEVMDWVLQSYKNVVGIGVDTASIDPGSSLDFPVHKKLAARGLYILENVNLHKKLPEHGCTAIVMPMKVAEGTGAPTRLIAICPKSLLNAKVVL